MGPYFTASLSEINSTSISEATCLLWGRDHFETFDGVQFEFGGNCIYKLASGNSWQINFQPVNCDLLETCTKVMYIQLGISNLTIIGKQISFKFGSDQTIIVPDNAPFNPVGTGINVERRDNYTYLEYSDGLRIKWDTGMVVYITVDGSYVNKTNGLCGSFNLNISKLKILIISYLCRRLIFRCKLKLSLLKKHQKRTILIYKT